MIPEEAYGKAELDEGLRRDAEIDSFRSSEVYMRTVFLLEPITEGAKAWIEANVDSMQVFGNAIAIEHRYVADIVSGLLEAGYFPHRDFTVR